MHYTPRRTCEGNRFGGFIIIQRDGGYDMTTGELTVYCGCEPVVDAEYQTDSDTPSPSVAIANAIAEAAGVDPLELPPLYGHVDIGALDAFLGAMTEPRTPGAILSFQIGTWNVFVRVDGKIRVCDATRSTAPKPAFESFTG